MSQARTEPIVVAKVAARVRSDDTPLSSKVIRNAAFGGLRYAIVAPIPFVMTPLILRKIGVAGYGTWAVFLAINGLTSLTDLGLVGTLSKFVAEYHARRDFAGLARVLNSGLTLFLALAATISTALFVSAPLITFRIFRGSNIATSDLSVLFRLFAVVVAANVLILMFSSATTGIQRLDITNLIGAGNVFLSAFFSAILLISGMGLRGLVYGYMASSVLTIAAYLITVRKLLPQVRMNPLQFDIAEARHMFGFSFRLYVTQAAVTVHNQVEKLFLSLLVGVAAVGWYDIASDVALKIRGAIGFVLSPVLPAASELDALGDDRRIRELYFRTHKSLALVGIPIVCYLVVISSRFVELWLGSGLRMVAYPLAILVTVGLVNLFTGPGFLIFAGSGQLKPGMDSALLGIVLNVVLSFGLIYRYGFAGAVLGTSASLIIASAYFVWVFHRETNYSFFRLLRESYVKPVACSIAVLLLILTVHPVRDLSWLGLIVMGLIFGALYSALILLTRFFDAYDWNKIEAFIPGVKQVRRLVRFA